MSRYKKLIIIIFILSLSLFLRIFLINKIPPSLSNDEVDYVYDAYSLAKTGKDILGKQFPLSFITDQKMSPVPIYFTALFLRFLPLNTFTARLSYALTGVLVVILTYCVTKQIFKSERLGLISMILVAISPWNLQISRIAYDANFALLFYMLAIFLFLKGKLLLSLLPFTLAYYSYHGTKIIFLPVLALLIWYKYGFKIFKDKKNYLRFCTFFVISLLIFISFYFVGSYEKGVERIDQVLFFNRKEAAEFVDYERGSSLAPGLLKKIFNNKPLYYFRRIKEGYFAYLNFLFNSGEESGLYSLWFRGNQYFIEFFFFIIGFYYLFQKNKRNAIFLTIFLFISVFPSALSSGKSSFGTRSLIGLPFLIMVISIGIINFVSIGARFKKRYFILAIVFLYCCSFLSYLYQYYFRYPLYGAENWYYSEQKAIEFIISQQKNKKKIILTHYHFPLFMRYAFTAQLDPQIAQKTARLDGDIFYDNIDFLRGCPNDAKGNPFDFLPNNSILITKWDWDCYKDIKANKEIRTLDNSRVMWRIYEKNLNSNSQL